MSSEQDVKDFYKSGTRGAADKLVKKFNAAAAEAVDKLQSPEVADAWQTNVSSDRAKKHFMSGTSKITAKDLTDGMTQKGKSAYTTATGLDSTVEKWAKNSKPYRDVATDFSKNKKIITSDADREYNMLENMRRMMAKKQELDG